MQFIFFDSFIFNCISLLFAFPKRCIVASGWHECMDRAGSPCFPWVSVGWWIRIGRKYRVSTMCWSLRVEDGWQFKSWIMGLASQSPRRCLRWVFWKYTKSCWKITIIVLRMKAMLLVTLVFSLTILMMASRATAHSYGTTYYGKRMAEDTPSLTKR